MSRRQVVATTFVVTFFFAGAVEAVTLLPLSNAPNANDPFKRSVPRPPGSFGSSPSAPGFGNPSPALPGFTAPSPSGGGSAPSATGGYTHPPGDLSLIAPTSQQPAGSGNNSNLLAANALPVPGTLGLLAMALAGIGVGAKRRRPRQNGRGRRTPS